MCISEGAQLFVIRTMGVEEELTKRSLELRNRAIETFDSSLFEYLNESGHRNW